MLTATEALRGEYDFDIEQADVAAIRRPKRNTMNWFPS